MAQGTALAQIVVLLVAASLPLPAQIREYLLRGDPRALQIARSFNTSQAPLQIAQVAFDPARYLWFATTRGLYRFDGQHLHQFSSVPATSVAVTQDGWVLTASADGLRATRRGEERQVSDVSYSSIIARGREIVAADVGGVWKGTIERLSKLDKAQANGLMTLDKAGNVWFGCGIQLCALSPDGAVKTFGKTDGVPPKNWPAAIRDDAENLWAWDTHRVVKITGARATIIDHSPTTTPASRWFNASRTSRGQIWLDAHRWIDPDGSYHAASWPTSMDLLRQSYTEDHQKQLWMASSSRGISILSPKLWVTGWQLNVDIPADPVTTTPVGSNEVLTATKLGLTRLDTVTDTWKLLPGAFQGDAVVSFSSDRNGGNWVLFRNRGIQHIDLQGTVIATVPWAGMMGTEYRVFYRDRLGTLWLGAKKELYRLDESRARLDPWPMPAIGGSPVAFDTSDDGQDWLGYEGGIARRTVQGWELVVPASALFSPRVREIAVGPGPSFWVCYRTTGPFSYVYKQDGQWKRRDFSADEGDGPASTWSILRDRRGWIWRGTKNGVFVSDGVHLEPHHWVHFTETHNLPSDEVAHLGLTEDKNGSIWVTTSRGPAKIEPDPAWFSETASGPRITRRRWRGTDEFWPGERARLDGQGSFELDFARWPGPAPRAAGVEYRLSPKEQNWVFTTLGTARYEDLEPGTYQFQMRPAEGGPVTIYAFQVVPLGSRVPWLWLLAGAAAPVTAAYSLWRIRRRKIIADYWASKRAYIARNQEAHTSDLISLGETVCGRYRIDSVLGAGGFSSVYLGMDLHSGIPVAVKVLHNQDELPGWQRKRFEIETQALAAIRNPGIVELLDSGVIENRAPFLVMRYISGRSLREVLKGGAIAAAVASRWILQLGEALAAAHANGVIHRDFKPENIIVGTQPGGEERLVIVDFGAATIQTGETANGTTIMLVSRDYAAPERIQGRSSPATDVYALAVIAFELLTGVRYVSLADVSLQGLRHALVGHPDEVIKLLAAGAAFDPANRPRDILEYSRQLAGAIAS